MHIEHLQDVLHPALAPLGAFYAGAMRLRRAAFGAGLLSSWRANAPTVAVGNIGWGGTGKTPLTGWLLDWALARGLAPLVLTRGYGARPEKLPLLVRPGNLAEEAGDEPLMLCRSHPGARVVVDPARSRAGRWAQEAFPPDLILLDDGFQHLGVRRDLDLVLLRPADLGRGWNRVIPAGSWREGASALRRADAFLVKIAPAGFEALLPRMEYLLRELRKPVFSFEIAPRGLARVLDAEPREHFAQQPYLLVSGVGDPAQVERTATLYFGYGPREHLIYPDHHPYARTDVERIERLAEQRRCAHVLCTPKDAVKLGPMAGENFWTFDLDVRFGPAWHGQDLEGVRFEPWWEARFERCRTRRAEELRVARRLAAARSAARGETSTGAGSPAGSPVTGGRSETSDAAPQRAEARTHFGQEK